MLQYCRYGDKTRAAHNTETNFLFQVHVLQNKSTHYVLFSFFFYLSHSSDDNITLFHHTEYYMWLFQTWIKVVFVSVIIEWFLYLLKHQIEWFLKDFPNPVPSNSRERRAGMSHKSWRQQHTSASVIQKKMYCHDTCPLWLSVKVLIFPL